MTADVAMEPATGSEVDLFGDGSVVLAQLEEGQGRKTPKQGDEVRVSVIATALDSSVVEEKQYVEHVVGSGSLGPTARAVDAALATMKAGGKASLRCSKDYGSAAGLPELATIDVSLHEIHETRDVSFCKDGSVLKKEIREGEGYHTPREGAHAALLVSAATDGRAALPGFAAAELQFVVGDGDVCDALECAALDMKVGERAVVTAKGSWCVDPRLGLHEVRADTVVLEVEMKGFDRQDDWMSEEAKIEFASRRKDVGNALLKAGRLQMALQRYSKVVDMFTFVDNFEPENSKKVIALKLACESNKAVVYLKLGDWVAARDACNNVLESDKQNIKVLFRRAQAQFHLNNFPACIDDCKKVVELDPQNKEVRTLLKQAQAGQKVDDKRAQGTFANMFGKRPAAVAVGEVESAAKHGDAAMKDASEG